MNLTSPTLWHYDMTPGVFVEYWVVAWWRHTGTMHLQDSDTFRTISKPLFQKERLGFAVKIGQLVFQFQSSIICGLLHVRISCFWWINMKNSYEYFVLCSRWYNIVIRWTINMNILSMLCRFFVIPLFELIYDMKTRKKKIYFVILLHPGPIFIRQKDRNWL